MFLPEEYMWVEPVLIIAAVIFVIDWIGNTITFSNRVINAFVTALLFGLIFGALTYFGYGKVEVTVSMTPSADAPAAVQGTQAAGQPN